MLVGKNLPVNTASTVQYNTNRFKGLHLIDRVPEELWTEVRDIVQEAVIKTIPKKKKCEKEHTFFGVAVISGERGGRFALNIFFFKKREN